MQSLRELVPAANRVAMLVNPTDPEGYQTLHDVQAAAGGQQILVREVASGRDIDAAPWRARRARRRTPCSSPQARSSTPRPRR
jgi:hypothetical protein